MLRDKGFFCSFSKLSFKKQQQKRNVGSVYHTFTIVHVFRKDNGKTFQSKQKVAAEYVKNPLFG